MSFVIGQVKTTSPDAYQVTPHRGVIDVDDCTNIAVKYISGIYTVFCYYYKIVGLTLKNIKSMFQTAAVLAFAPLRWPTMHVWARDPGLACMSLYRQATDPTKIILLMFTLTYLRNAH